MQLACDSECPLLLISVWLNQDGALMKMKRCCAKCAVMGIVSPVHMMGCCLRCFFFLLCLGLGWRAWSTDRPRAIPEGGSDGWMDGGMDRGREGVVQGVPGENIAQDLR